jgi:hypothetical protein
LDEKNVPAADVFVDLAIVFTIGKLAQGDSAGCQVQKPADIACKLGISTTAENLQFTHGSDISQMEG